MEQVFEFEEGCIRNEYKILPCNPSLVFLEVVYMYVDNGSEWNELYRTIVDVVFIHKLIDFIWSKMNTNHGPYYLGKPRTPDGVDLLERLNRDSIELHVLIAFLSNIPNTCNHKYVEHLSYSYDNRASNLIRCPTEPYKVLPEEELPYPDGIKQVHGITWHGSFFRVSHPQLRDSSWDTSDTGTIQERFQQAEMKRKELTNRDETLYNKKMHFDRQWECLIELYDKYEEDDCVFSA
jgi:hypothetical protein